MDLKTALNLFNLNINYSQAELKTNYRKLVTKYHPDKYPEDKKQYAEERMKEINEAKSILDNYSKQQNHKNKPNPENKTKTSHYPNETEKNELNELKSKYLKIIKLELKEINNINSKDILFAKNKYWLIQTIISFDLMIVESRTINSLKKAYREFIAIYKDLLYSYAIDCTQSSKVTVEGIVSCCSLKEVRDKIYSTYDSMLQQELTKYYNNPYIEDMQKLISAIKNGYILSCLYGYDDIYSASRKFDTHIFQEIRSYSLRKQLLDELKIDKNFDKKIILSLENAIDFEKQFYSIYNQIDKFTKFKCKIRSIFKRTNH